MVFLDNKYRKWYDNIIENAQSNSVMGYSERHHIIPKSLGGPNSKDNIIALTAREHFLCHLLLTKFTTGADQKLMLFALGKFIQTSPNQHRKFNSWEYSKIRESISIARTGKKHSAESRQKMSDNMKGRIPWNKGLSGIKNSYESNKKRSATLKGKTLESKVGIERAVDIKNRISKTKEGKPSGMLGKRHSNETKQLMSQNMSKPRGPQQRLDRCPHCDAISVSYRHIKFCKNNKGA